MAAAWLPRWRIRPRRCGVCRFSIVSSKSGTFHPIGRQPDARWRPRFGTDSLFFLSSSGPGDGLWRLQNDKAVEIWKGSDEPLVESPAVSPLGDRVTVLLKRNGKLQLTLVSADGAAHRSFAPEINVRGTSTWSPDGKWIAAGGSDPQGAGLFKVPVDGGDPVRLVNGPAYDPVWSS